MIKESNIFVIIVHVCNEQSNDDLNHAEKWAHSFIYHLFLPEEQIFSFVVVVGVVVVIGGVVVVGVVGVVVDGVVVVLVVVVGVVVVIGGVVVVGVVITVGVVAEKVKTK